MSSLSRIVTFLNSNAMAGVATEARPHRSDEISEQSFSGQFDTFHDLLSNIPWTDFNSFVALTHKGLSLATASIKYILAPDNRSIANAANITSAFGVLINHWGAVNIDNPKGILGIGIGRSTDVFDGKLARTLHQESEVGKTLDHSFDKLAMADILYHAWKKNVGPKPALAAIAMLNSANAIITVTTKVMDPEKELAPTRSGKLSIALQGISIGAFMFEKQTEQQDNAIAKVFRLIGHLTTGTSLALGMHSTLRYAKRLTESD